MELTFLQNRSEKGIVSCQRVSYTMANSTSLTCEKALFSVMHLPADTMPYQTILLLSR